MTLFVLVDVLAPWHDVLMPEGSTASPCVFLPFKKLTRAPLGYSAERAPLGGQILPPCLTPERMVVERRRKRQTKALNKTNLKNTKNFT